MFTFIIIFCWIICSFQDDRASAGRPITTKDIACLLILFKRRHRLSIQCLSDLLSLLRLFGVTEAPRSWYQLKNLVKAADPTPTYFFLCSHCSSASTSSSNCSNCGHPLSTDDCQNTFLSLSIKNQLQIILNNNIFVDLFSSSASNTITDIKDGNFYRQLKMMSSGRFLTLTMNIDGVETKKGSQKSIWPILLALNELPLKQRYNIENTIFAGIWSGPHKPTRLQMKSFLSPIVEELSLLEQGTAFEHYQKASNAQNIIIKVFLVGACCDKPAQALVQNIPEPIAEFGCGRCEIAGEVL
jgi:hypothetical protein